MKLKQPLLSSTAHGTIKPRLTFSQRKSGAQVRIQKAQKDRITPARTIQRNKFQQACAGWNGLTDEEKIAYNVRAKYEPYTGFNLFVHEFFGALPPAGNFLLLETGGYLLLENNNKIIL